MFPTASSVLGDILAIVKSMGSSEILPLMKCEHNVNALQVDINDTKNKYYIAITASNTPGVIGCIGEICGRHNISLASVLQKGIDVENTADIVVITESCTEKNIKTAINELEKIQIS